MIKMTHTILFTNNTTQQMEFVENMDRVMDAVLNMLMVFYEHYLSKILNRLVTLCDDHSSKIELGFEYANKLVMNISQLTKMELVLILGLIILSMLYTSQLGHLKKKLNEMELRTNSELLQRDEALAELRMEKKEIYDSKLRTSVELSRMKWLNDTLKSKNTKLRRQVEMFKNPIKQIELMNKLRNYLILRGASEHDIDRLASWKVEVVPRGTGTRQDVYYYGENGVMMRSMKEAGDCMKLEPMYNNTRNHIKLLKS
tara:strand:- start:134 stop:904 length:771 start_codon:yes stop_codon:yes gene_type:complete